MLYVMRVVLLSLITFLNAPLVLLGQGSAGCLANPPFFREKIWVGAGEARKVVRFPAPSGFESVFSADWDVNPYDRFRVGRNLDVSNICLLFFKPLKNNPRGEGRSFTVQMQRAFEDRQIGECLTCDITYPVKSLVARQKLRKAGQPEGKADPNVPNAEQAMKQHGAEILGIFEDSPVSLGFTMTLKTMIKAENDAAKAGKVYAIMMMPMGGGLIQLYAEAEYNSEADRLWAENAVRAWRKNILSFNPPVKSNTASPPAPDPLEGFEPAPFWGGMLGIVVSTLALLLQWFERRRATRLARTVSLDTQSNLPSAET